MPFTAQGAYTGEDAPTPHVEVVTETFVGILQARRQVTVLAGTVLEAAPLGVTQVGKVAPSHKPAIERDGKPVTAWMEHPTAKVGDVLPMADITAAIEVAVGKRAKIAEYWAAEAAKPKPPVAPVVPSLTLGKQTLTEADVEALLAMVHKGAKP